MERIGSPDHKKGPQTFVAHSLSVSTIQSLSHLSISKQAFTPWNFIYSKHAFRGLQKYTWKIAKNDVIASRTDYSSLIFVLINIFN